ncbi:hypothetical protein MMPV_006610 [Pyropia vietnamensis]
MPPGGGRDRAGVADEEEPLAAWENAFVGQLTAGAAGLAGHRGGGAAPATPTPGFRGKWRGRG